MRLDDKIAGALYGLAIGDAMGAPVEKWPAARIAATFDSVNEFLPATHSGDPLTGKGGGRFTDDTLMTEALIRAYSKCQNHMDSYDFEKYMLPEMAQTEVWVPERQRVMAILERLYWPEKYPWIRLFVNNSEPRSAGIGNRVNCGVAMYMMPVGAVNAGDPAAAYQEAASLAIAHNESFAVEAAAVMAAASAAAFGAGSTIEQVVHTAKSMARDGTGKAIRSVLDVVDVNMAREEFIDRVRAAVSPYDQRPDYLPDDKSFSCTGIQADVGRPSRESSIEELPVALAVLLYGNGDFMKTLSTAVFYGRDCDSIAGMACSLFGAIHGVEAIPSPLRHGVNEANRRDFSKLAVTLTNTVRIVFEKDKQRFASRLQACV
ncbi:MAG: ADP-ribosylglycohydrolase family protein [Alicyclobacillus sp.]|nr:ADP-ribosylglycohydrolase family protein [Alicyclobacillus sp.]